MILDLSIEQDLRLYCSKCGNELSNTEQTRNYRGEISLKIEPCLTCLDEAVEAAKGGAE